MDADPAGIVRKWFDAFAAGDMSVARQLFPNDSVLHAGRPVREHRGLDAFLAWYQKRRETAGPSFRYEVEEIMPGKDHVAALITLFTRQGVSKQLALYKIASGQITDIWLFEE